MTLSIMTLSIMTLSIMCSFATPSIYDIQHDMSAIMLGVDMANVVILNVVTPKCRYGVALIYTLLRLTCIHSPIS